MVVFAQDISQRSEGFANEEARLRKCPRVNEDAQEQQPGLHATVPDLENGGPSDMWAAFAQAMSSDSSRARY